MTSHDGGGGGGSFFDRLDHWLEEMERRFTDWLDRVFGRESEAPGGDPSAPGDGPVAEQPADPPGGGDR